MMVYFLKSALCLLVLLLLYHLLLKREKMYHFNRFYLLFALVFSFTAPLLNVPFIGELLVEPEAESTVVLNDYTKGRLAMQQLETPVSYFFEYLIIMCLFLLRFVVRLRKFYKQIRSNESISYKGKQLVLLKEDGLPYTFLNWIFVSKKYYQNEQIEEVLLTHEMAHLEQKHSWDILFIEILRVLLWWNPLLSYYKKAIALNHEFLADAYVLGKHNGIVAYQELLLNKAATGKALVLSSPFNFTITKRRLKMMTKTTSRAKRRMLVLLTLPLFALLFFAVVNKATAQNSKKQSKEERAIKDSYFEKTIFMKEMENGMKSYKPYAALSNKEKKAIPPPPVTREELSPLPEGTVLALLADGRVVIKDNESVPPPPPAPPVPPAPPAPPIDRIIKSKLSAPVEYPEKP